MDDILLDSLYV